MKKIIFVLKEILFWVISIFMFLFAIAVIPYSISNVFMILSGLCLLPVLINYLNKKYKYNIKIYMQILAFIILFILSVSTYKAPTESNNEITKINNTQDTIKETEEQKTIRLENERKALKDKAEKEEKERIVKEEQLRIEAENQRKKALEEEEKRKADEKIEYFNNGNLAMLKETKALVDNNIMTIAGAIKNISGRTYRYVQVVFNLYDDSGAQVGTAMDNINNLESDGIWKFQAIGMGRNASKYKVTEVTGY